MSIQALRERHDAKAKEVRALNEKASGFDPEVDGPVFNALINEIDEIKAAITRHHQVLEASFDTDQTDELIEQGRKFNAPPGKATNSRNDQAFRNFLRGGKAAMNADDQKAFFNTMSTTTGSEGGFTVQTDVATMVTEALKEFGGMREVADVIVTTQGNPQSWPTSDGTSEEGEIVAENATASSLDLTVGTLPLNLFKFSSKIVAVPIELIQDSNVDVVAFVLNRLAVRLGRVTNRFSTTGTGTGQPNGVQTASTAGRIALTGAATTVSYDDLVRLQHSVDPAYRRSGNCSFMMNDQTVRELRLIKDGNGRPIFVPGYEMTVPGGAPDTLLGRPLVTNQNMPVMAANAKSILFGDFKQYKIRDAMQMEFMRWGENDSNFGSKGQVGFLTFMRSGGNLIDVGGAIKHYQNSAT